MFNILLLSSIEILFYSLKCFMTDYLFFTGMRSNIKKKLGKNKNLPKNPLFKIMKTTVSDFQNRYFSAAQ